MVSWGFQCNGHTIFFLWDFIFKCEISITICRINGIGNNFMEIYMIMNFYFDIVRFKQHNTLCFTFENI